jgi:DNA repair protein RAD16
MPESEPESAEEFKESSGTSGSEFVASEEDEDDSEDEEIMLDAAVRLSLQTIATNGASTSSGRTLGPSPAAALRAAAAERRLARNQKALALATEYDDDDADASDSDSRSVTSMSDEEPLAKKVKKPKKQTTARSKAVVTTLQDLRQRRKRALDLKKELKKEERELMAKLGRRLTHVSAYYDFLDDTSYGFAFRLRKRRSPCTGAIPSSRRRGVT